MAAKPIVEIIKIGYSEPEPLPDGDRPLSGIRALDLTRILAGPIAARTLAEHGADVLMVTARYAELACTLRRKYAGIADAYVLGLPLESRDDEAIRRVVRDLKADP